MPKSCIICEKGPTSGIKYKRRGMIKRKGGAGSKIIGKTARKFLPNLQSVRTLQKGVTKRVNVCARCLKAGKVVKV